MVRLSPSSSKGGSRKLLAAAVLQTTQLDEYTTGELKKGPILALVLLSHAFAKR